MTLRTRIRKIVKWTALAMVWLLFYSWIGSNAYHVGWHGRGYALWCVAGAIVFYHWETAEVGEGLQLGEHDWNEPKFKWWFRVDRWKQSSVEITAPLWAPLLATAGVALAARKLDRTATLRARNNCCNKCGYHRAGLTPDALCPECGV